MICNRPAPLAAKATTSTNRRSTLPRIEIAPRRSEACQYQASAEYQAARLGKLLSSQPSPEQARLASVLLGEMVDAYRQAILCARHD